MIVLVYIYFALAFRAIEFVSTLYTSKLFIYEELIQGATLQCFILCLTDFKGNPTPIIEKAYLYGFLPAYRTRAKWWYLCPWINDSFDYFFKASEIGMAIFQEVNKEP